MPVSAAGHAGALVSEGGTATAPTPPKSLVLGERKRADLMRLLTQRDWTST